MSRKPAETKSAPKAKDKVDTGRTAKGSDDPVKTHNRFLLAVLVKVSLLEYL